MKKEGGVFPNRTAEGEASVIEVLGAAAQPVFVVKPVVGIECGVAEVFEGRTMELVRTSPAGDGNLSAGTPKLGREGGYLNLHFFDRIERDQIGGIARGIGRHTGTIGAGAAKTAARPTGDLVRRLRRRRYSRSLRQPCSNSYLSAGRSSEPRHRDRRRRP